MEKHTNEVEDNQMRALSWKTRVSYGLGDTACNVVYGMIGSLLTIFYTDYVGISAAAIGVIMLISRIFDGCSTLSPALNPPARRIVPHRQETNLGIRCQ